MDKLNPADLFIPEIRQLLKARNFPELKKLIEALNPIDLADALGSFAPERAGFLLLRLLDSRRALIVFEELELLQQEFILHHMDSEHLAPTFRRFVSRRSAPPDSENFPNAPSEKWKRISDKVSWRVLAPIPPFPPRAWARSCRRGL